MKNLLFVFCLFSLHGLQAQNQPSIADLQRQLMAMQRQLMQQLQNNPFNSPNLNQFQQDSSFFYFHSDTTFSGENGSGSMQFFQMSPFGDSTLMQGFPGLSQMFQEFFNFEPGINQQPLHGGQSFPKDDGNLRKSEDDLLPEDRLREQESQPLSKPAPLPEPVPMVKSKVKTIKV